MNPTVADSRAIRALSFLPDDSLVSVDQSGGVTTWDAENVQRLGRVAVEAGVELAVLGNLGHHAWMAWAERAAVVDIRTGKIVREIDGELVAFSVDDRVLLVGGACPAARSLGDQGDDQDVEGGPYSAVATDPRGIWQAWGAPDGTVTLLNTDTGVRHPIPAHDDAVCALAFAPDGQWIASASTGTVRVHHCHSGEVVFTASSPALPASLTVSGDGACVLATMLRAGRAEIRSWDANSGRPVWAWDLGPATNAPIVAFSPDGRLLAIGQDEAVRVIDIFHLSEVGAPAWALPALGPGPPAVATIRAEGRDLVISTSDGEIRTRAHGADIAWLAVSPDGSYVVTSTGTAVFAIWNVATGEKAQIVRTPPGACASGGWSADGQTLFTNPADGSVPQVWDFHDGQVTAAEHAPVQPALAPVDARGNMTITAVAPSPDGRLLVAFAITDHGLEVITWDLETAAVLARNPIDSDPAGRILWSPDSAHILAGGRSWSREFLLGQADGPDCIVDLDTRSASWHPDGQHLWLVDAARRSVGLLPLSGRMRVDEFDIRWLGPPDARTDGYASVMVASSGHTLTSIDGSGTMDIRSTADGSIIWSHASTGIAAVSHDGLTLALSDGRAVRRVDPTTGQERCLALVHNPVSVQFSSPGTWLLTIQAEALHLMSDDGQSRLLPVRLDTPALDGPHNAPVAFSVDETTLATLAGGTVHTWHLASFFEPPCVLEAPSDTVGVCFGPTADVLVTWTANALSWWQQNGVVWMARAFRPVQSPSTTPSRGSRVSTSVPSAATVKVRSVPGNSSRRVVPGAKETPMDTPS